MTDTNGTEPTFSMPVHDGWKRNNVSTEHCGHLAIDNHGRCEGCYVQVYEPIEQGKQ